MITPSNAKDGMNDEIYRPLDKPQLERKAAHRVRMLIARKFRPRKRRIRDGWPKMARKERLDGEAHV